MNSYNQHGRSGGVFCQDCGEPLSPEATFCPNCGSRRMSKPGIDDKELPFQYIAPEIQNQTYAPMDEDFSFSDLILGDDYGADDDYSTDDYTVDAYPVDDYPGEQYDSDYDDFEKNIRPTRPAGKRSSAGKRGTPQTGRRAPERKRRVRRNADPSSTTAAIRMIVAAGFLGLVIAVSLIGFFFFLFAGDGGVEISDTETTDVSSVEPAVSSDSPSEEEKTEKPTVHLLPEDVSNKSYKKYTLDQNTFTTAMASSFISAKLTHGSTDLAFDGDPETSWQDGVKGYGIGEWLLAYNADGSAVKVSEVTVYNGYQNPKFNNAKKDMYLVNSRVSDFTLTFDDGTSESFTLEDIKDPQTFTFKARKTCYVRFTIGGVYKGTKYKDTCVGEIIYK